jgi:TolA-binding protein
MRRPGRINSGESLPADQSVPVPGEFPGSERGRRGIPMKKIMMLTFLSLFALLFASYAQDAVQPSSSDTASSDLERVNDDVRYENAAQLLKLKKKDKALALFGEYLELFPDGAHRKEALRSVGDVYLDRFDYRRAIKYYQQLYEEFGSEEEGVGGFFQSAICHSRMGNVDKASEIYKRIIEMYPSSVYASKSKTQLDIEEMIK